jgi:hypothetical protein
MTATITLYAVRNRDGKWFRSKGYGGYGETWVADIGKAKLYTKIGQARGRVSFFAGKWPEHGVPDIVEFTATMTAVLPEAGRVSEVAERKARQEAARAVRIKQAEVERATRDKQDAEARLARLRGGR